MQNVVKNTDKATGRAFVQALKSWTDEQLAFSKAEYFAHGRAYIERVEDRHQYPFKRGRLFGMSSTKGTESMNNANRPFRGMGMYSAFVRLVERDHDRHQRTTIHS